MSNKKSAITGFLRHSKKRKASSTGKCSKSKVKKDSLPSPELENENNTIEANLPLATFNTVMYEPKNLDRDDNYYGESARNTFINNETKVAVFNFVLNNFEIPDDFDKSSSSLKYGARSGMCYEERVVRAYRAKKLNLKKSSVLNLETPDWMMCSDCGATGHFPIRCPNAIEQ